MRSADRLTERFIRDIKAGAWGPSGTLLPVYDTLVAHYGTSLYTLTQAMEHLRMRGLTEMHGRRTYITCGQAMPDTPYMQAKKPTKVIAVLVANLDSLFFGAFCDLLSDLLADHGYCVAAVPYTAENLQEKLSALRHCGIDGVIAAVSDRPAALNACAELVLPCVLIDSRTPNLPRDCVVSDYYPAAYRIAQKFATDGFEHFYAITYKTTYETDDLTRGFRDGAAAAGNPMTDADIISGQNSHGKDGRTVNLARRIVRESKKAAVLFPNKLDVPYFLQDCAKHGLILHRDVEVAMWNYIRFNTPTELDVTTVESSISRMAECAATCILDCIQGKNTAPRVHKISYHIIWRGGH